MQKKGIDVSKHQGEIDWTKVKNAGIEFAILRIGYGMYENQKDVQFENNYNNAKANGIPVGIYTYSYASNSDEARKEAELVLKWLNGRKLDLPIFYDIEDKAQQNLTKTMRNNMCKAFCEVIEKAGYWAGIYANKYWSTSLIDGATLGKRYVYWVAQYNDKCTYNGEYAIWQYSSSGKVNGIKGNVDMNYMYRDLVSEIGSSNKTTEKINTSTSSLPDLSGYTGVSLVDGLKSVGVDSSLENRKNLYRQAGFYGAYAGTAAQNTELLNKLKGKTTTTSNYYPKYYGTSSSLVDALKSMGIDSSFSNRKKIAKANGISAYLGTAKQNTNILNLLKQGKLKK